MVVRRRPVEDSCTCAMCALAREQRGVAEGVESVLHSQDQP